jgi:hypothetical protein
MRTFFRKWRVLFATLGLVAGTITPIALTAGPAVAADDSFVISDYTTNIQGRGGSEVLQDLGATSQQSNLYFEGTVQSTGGQCWPFACGNGANAYFQGKNVWVVYQSGTSYCWTSTNRTAAYTNTACGGGHTYSLIVQATAWDGRSGSESWVDVGATNDNSGKGVYLTTNGSGQADYWNSSANSTRISYHTVVG